MKNQRLRFATVFLSLFLLPCLGAEELVHVLQKGETLYAISRRYKVPADAIMSVNNLRNPDSLKAGQKLRIPGMYTVEKGDTLYGVARKFGLPMDQLLADNKLTRESKLQAGQKLYIPALPVATPGGANSGEKGKSAAETAVSGADPVTLAFKDPRSYESAKVDSSIIWPVTAKEISYLAGKLYGVSITSEKGEKVKAVSSGTVLSTGPYRGFGQVAFLQSQSGYIYVYGGLDRIAPSPGDTLAFGDEIGSLGSDSLSGKPRLYFMVYNKDVPVDPAKAPRGY